MSSLFNRTFQPEQLKKKVHVDNYCDCLLRDNISVTVLTNPGTFINSVSRIVIQSVNLSQGNQLPVLTSLYK